MAQKDRFRHTINKFFPWDSAWQSGGRIINVIDSQRKQRSSCEPPKQSGKNVSGVWPEMKFKSFMETMSCYFSLSFSLPTIRIKQYRCNRCSCVLLCTYAGGSASLRKETQFIVYSFSLMAQCRMALSFSCVFPTGLWFWLSFVMILIFPPKMEIC